MRGVVEWIDKQAGREAGRRVKFEGQRDVEALLSDRATEGEKGREKARDQR